MDPLSETDVIQTESPENFVVIFEILPIAVADPDLELRGGETRS